MLTHKQEMFCINYVETGNASEAYRRSYSCEKMSDKTVNEAPSRALADSKIIARIEELRKPVREKAQITLEQHLADLKALRDKADASEKFGPAIQAEIARGKASGLYVEKVEHGSDPERPVKVDVTLSPDDAYLQMIGKK